MSKYEYIGEVALKAPQHIEDKLAALAAKATQGEWAHKTRNYPLGETGDYGHTDEICSGAQRVFCEADGDEQVEHNMRHTAALHNAAHALLAVVRAAREVTTRTFAKDDLVLAYDAKLPGDTARRLRAALAALDAVEV